MDITEERSALDYPSGTRFYVKLLGDEQQRWHMIPPQDYDAIRNSPDVLARKIVDRPNRLLKMKPRNVWFVNTPEKAVRLTKLDTVIGKVPAVVDMPTLWVGIKLKPDRSPKVPYLMSRACTNPVEIAITYDWLLCICHTFNLRAQNQEEWKASIRDEVMNCNE